MVVIVVIAFLADESSLSNGHLAVGWRSPHMTHTPGSTQYNLVCLNILALCNQGCLWDTF